MTQAMNWLLAWLRWEMTGLDDADPMPSWPPK